MNSQPKDLLKYAKTYVVKKIAVLAFGEVLLALILFLWGDTTNGFRKFTLFPLTMGIYFGTINR